jgi:hypothetical protein
MSAPTDYYRILHVQPDAPTAIIHASYRTLVERARAAGRMAGEGALLDAAYAVLGDPQRRAAYDRERAGAAGLAEADAESATGAAAARCCLFCGTAHGLTRALERDDECAQCSSPLFPAERHRYEFSGQRMLKRIPKRRAIEIRVAWPQPVAFVGEMRDVSLNGMAFLAAVHLTPNQIVRIDCTELRALGRVAHVESGADVEGRANTGVEFLTLRFWQVRGSFISAKV